MVHITLECTKFSGLRRDIQWQGTGTRKIAEISALLTWPSAQPILWLVQGLFAQLERACLAGTEQNPQQAAENLDARLEPLVSVAWPR